VSAEKELAASYRKRAEQLRKIADLDRNRRTRDTLLNVAQDYDNMADTLDAIDKANSALRKPHVSK
jgi:hypothetical protein